MKKFITLMVAAICAVSLLFGGCIIKDGVNGANGADGKDGQNLTVNDVLEYARGLEGNENLSDEELLKKIFNYTDDQLSQAVSLQASINHSLLSAVSVLSRLTYNDVPGYVRSGTRYQPTATNPEYHQFALGAGVIVGLNKEEGDAYVITNCHVVRDPDSTYEFAKEVYLYLYGQDTQDVNYSFEEEACQYGGRDVYYAVNAGMFFDYQLLPDQKLVTDEKYCIEAEVVGASVDYDMALLRVENSEVLKKSGAVAAEFSTEDDVYMGAPVYAVGNPRGYGISATEGIISKDSEEIQINMSETSQAIHSYRVMRTDAAINGGNSGGGLYNNKGKLIGIVNSKSVSDEIDNMGYALPASNIKRLYALMREKYEGQGGNFVFSGGVDRASLSLETEIVSTRSRKNTTLNLTEIEETLAVKAASGEFAAGDIIKRIKITVGGKVVEDAAVDRAYRIDDLMISAREGCTVTLTVSRNGTETEINAPYAFEHKE